MIFLIGVLFAGFISWAANSVPEDQMAALEFTKERAEDKSYYGTVAALKPTDYYAEAMYYYLEMNRLERKMADLTADGKYEYVDAYRLVMIEETPDELQKDIVERLDRMKTEDTSRYDSFMHKMNEDRPSCYPEYRKATDVRFYLSQCEIAGYHTRQWVMSKGFKPFDYDRAVKFNNGKEPPPYPNPLDGGSQNSYYQNDYGDYTSYALPLEEGAWCYGEGHYREIHFPTKYAMEYTIWNKAAMNLKNNHNMKIFPWGKKNYGEKWSIANIYDEEFVENWKKIKELFKDTGISRKTPATSQQSTSASATKPVVDTWTCSCGNVNVGSFCPRCGKKRAK